MKKKIAKNSRAVFPYPMSELLYDFLKYHPIYLMKSDDKKERKKIWQDQDSNLQLCRSSTKRPWMFPEIEVFICQIEWEVGIQKFKLKIKECYSSTVEGSSVWRDKSTVWSFYYELTIKWWAPLSWCERLTQVLICIIRIA